MNNKKLIMLAAIALPCITFASPGHFSQAHAAAASATAVSHQKATASRLPWARSTVRPAKDPAEISVNFTQTKLKRPKRNGSLSERKLRRRRVGSVRKVPEAEVAQYKALVTSFAREYGVPVDLAHAIVTVESNYYPKAQGGAGEIGLMQIMPATARGMGYKGSKQGLFHPETNIRFGMKYLATAYKLGGKTTCGAVLKYNAGHGAKRMNPISSAYCAKVKRLLKK